MYNIIKSITDKEKKIAAGIMSGTSLDGIDVAFCEITGHGTDTRLNLLYFETVPFSSAEKAALLMNSSKETSDVSELCRLNKLVGVNIGKAVLSAAANGKISMDNVDFISSHGQTVFHMPEIGATLQIGEPADIAAITGKPVTGDFRPSDTAYGGQGAPLVPFVDYLLFRSSSTNRVLFNIGGIGNVTILTKNCRMEDVSAFDTGPGNVIIDNLMRLHTKGGECYDDHGKLARSGRQSMKFNEYLADIDVFLAAKPPKSTGRELYTIGFAEKILKRAGEMGLTFPDILASVTNHTAYALWYSLTRHSSVSADEILVSGGGAKNDYLMECMDTMFPGKVKAFDEKDCGFSADAKEAVAFAILGNEFLHGGYNNIKSATGAERSVIMGKLTLSS